MFGPSSTAARIDAFESRFTMANGAHFLIAANGKEAWPISEAEWIAFRELYRDRMTRARWLRRGALIAIVPLLILLGKLADVPPGRMGTAWQAAYLLVLFGLPLAAFLQHSLTSDLTQWAIARPLKHRITTRHPPAITPPATMLGRCGKWLLVTGFAVEIAIQLYHALAGSAELAAHMRVLYGLQSGTESLTAGITGRLSSVMMLVILAGAAAMFADRRRRRDAAKAEAKQGSLHRLANSTKSHLLP